MKKFMVLGFLSILIILGAIYMINTRSTTFNQAVPDMSEITAIEIIKSSTDKEVVLEKNDVKKLVQSWSEMELKADKMGSLDFEESYWITLKANDERKYGLTVYDDKYLLVYDFSKRTKKDSSRSYQIISGADLDDIEQYF
ncbi:MULTISPECIES: DUF5301 domain-containing protein [Bacillaceae]|uniref:DUF5301 domain-containing protein n=1 Tax=Bacillaceae TaxID=186817 RepID=UPI002964EF74|nr:DUF5301 domain-containing protein [Bacillus infantis]MDW2876128.1 DUF5301 domain-containing protein [Bacillus infantis]